MLKVAQYQPDLFHSLPTLFSAGTDLIARDGIRIIWEEFRNIFESHNEASTFGLGLLHRHFDLNDAERLVEFNETSTPWNVEGSADLLGGSIRPQSWLFTADGKVVPYEFYFAPHNAGEELSLEKKSAFLEDVFAALKKHGLRDLVGLRLYPGEGYEGRVELTEGRANINFHPSQVYLYSEVVTIINVS
jgi:hypothetical protein